LQEAEFYVEAELVWFDDLQMGLYIIKYITCDEFGLFFSLVVNKASN